jgi:hypothetical protein
VGERGRPSSKNMSVGAILVQSGLSVHGGGGGCRNGCQPGGAVATVAGETSTRVVAWLQKKCGDRVVGPRLTVEHGGRCRDAAA